MNEQPPVICLPGLTRNSRDFHLFASKLSSEKSALRTVISIESRGRGRSDRDPDPARYTVPLEAADILTVLEALNIANADFVGTSRGGLLLHVLAATAPQLLRRVVLNDIGPVIELEGLRHIQNYLSTRPEPRSRTATLKELRLIHQPAFPALADEDWEDMLDAIYRSESGLMLPDFDPAIAEQTRALDLTSPLPDLWALFDAMQTKPVMVVRGENSTLLSSKTVTDMEARHPRLAIHTAKGQGHAPLLHREDVFNAVSQFLNAS